MTNSATETKSMGLRADAQLSAFFALRLYNAPWQVTTFLLPGLIRNWLYRDKTTFVHLPGLAKNSPTLTQTAPNQTAEPLGFIAGEKTDYLPLRQFIMTHNFRLLIMTHYLEKFSWHGRLAPALTCIWQFSGFVFWNLQNRPMSIICKSSIPSQAWYSAIYRDS